MQIKILDKLAAYNSRKQDIWLLRHKLENLEAIHEKQSKEDFGIADDENIAFEDMVTLIAKVASDVTKENLR